MSKTVRVLMVIGSMNRGGAETVIMNLYRKIDKTKVQFDFVENTLEKSAYDEEILSLGGKIFNCPHYSIKKHFQYVTWWKHFFAKHPEYKIIHGHIGSTAAIYLEIAKKHGAFTIAHSHSADTSKSLSDLPYKIYSHPTRYIADYFIGCSYNAGLTRYGKKVSNDSKRFKVLNNGIDVKKYLYNQETRNRVRYSLGINENTIVLGHTGRFNTVKNHRFLLQVFKEYTKINPDSKLLLVGDGELRGEIEQKIKELDLTNQVILVGVVSNVYDYLQAMDVFVFPSLYEGISLATIEAQSAGLKCFISAAVDQNTDITGNVTFKSLEESAKEWAIDIHNTIPVNNYQRDNVINKVIEAGYDIESSTKWLQDFYLEVANER